MSDEQLMITTFTKAYNKYIYDEMVIGQLAHTELKDGVKTGAEVDVVMPAMVNLFDYTGGDLNDAELTTTTTAKVKFDKGKAFHFEVDEVKKQQIENAPDLKQKVELAKEYSSDAIKQFAAAVDTAYGQLYTRAGHYLSGESNAAIKLDADYAKEILAYMQAEFQRGDRKGHTNWIDGQMVAIVPPEYQFYLGKLDDFKYVAFLEELVRAVESHLADSGFKLDSLASELRLSKSTMNRKIKTMTGLTPMDFVKGIRLRTACRLLRDGKLTVSEIAYTVGFSDPKYFAKCFKEEYGQTPSQFQEQEKAV